MVRNTLMFRKLRQFIERDLISPSDRCLVVCGGEFDHDVLEALGFKDFTISSILPEDACTIENYIREDAQCLSFNDCSFDNVIVHAGLHHCRSPHAALCEMYRVARKNVIVFEAQDSAVMRLLVRLGFAAEYELDAVAGHRGKSGGVNDSPVPNYIYRWTSREVEKIVRSLDPARMPNILFYREFFFNPCLLRGRLGRHTLTRTLGPLARPVITLFKNLLNLFFRNQGNAFTVMIRKHETNLQP